MAFLSTTLQGKLFCGAFFLASPIKQGRKTLIEFCDNKEQELCS